MLKSVLLAAVLAAITHASWAQSELNAARVTSDKTLLEPEGAFWRKAKPVTVKMSPQNITTPMHTAIAVKSMRVKAVHNDAWLAFLIEWKDKTRNDTLVTDKFGDQVAVELPVQFKKDELPTPMMGNPDGRVNILQWRAVFQHDLDKGGPEIKTLYPNANVDVYPDQILQPADAAPYKGAVSVENPVCRPKGSPVIDQIAEGWGTLTAQKVHLSDGRGLWKNGMWHVVIMLPLSIESPNSPKLLPGDQTVAAFALWDGGSGEVGSRKAWSDWLPVTLEK